MPSEKTEKPRDASRERAEEQGLAAQLKALADSERATSARTAAIAKILDDLSIPSAGPVNSRGRSIRIVDGSYDVVKVHLLKGDSHGISQRKMDLAVHPPDRCLGVCVIHNPSENHMRDWPMMWSVPDMCMFRECSHHVWHPDYDHIDYAMRAGHPTTFAFHTCCEEKCCEPHYI